MVQRRDKQKKEFNNEYDYSLWCVFLLSSHKSLLSHWTSQQTNIFYSAAGNAKIYLKNYNSYIIPRLTLLIETFIHTYNHSFTVLFSKSINTIFFTSLETFSLTSWTLLFLGHFLFFWDLISLLFLWASLILLSIRGSPPHRHNSVDLRTRLPGCASHQVCSTYVSTPQGQPSGPDPGCYL